MKWGESPSRTFNLWWTIDAQVIENAGLSFIWAVLNICLKWLSSSCFGFFKGWKEVEIENCAIGPYQELTPLYGDGRLSASVNLDNR